MNLLARCTPISLVQHLTSRNYNTWMRVMSVGGVRTGLRPCCVTQWMRAMSVGGVRTGLRPCCVTQCRVIHMSAASSQRKAAAKSRADATTTAAGSLVYRTHMTNYVYWLYAASCATSLLAAGVTAVTFCQQSDVANVADVMGSSMMFVELSSPMITTGALMATVTLMLILFQGMLRRTIFTIHYSDDTEVFTALTFNWRLARNEIKFKAGEMEEREAQGIDQLRGNFLIHGRQYVVLEKDFVSPMYLNMMLGRYKK